MASGQQMLAPTPATMHKTAGGTEARFIPVTISGGNGSSAPQTGLATSGGNGLSGSGNGGTQRGYTILVPANVRFRGVNMQLDLKIDQKTLAAASSISKAVQDAVNARQFGAGGVHPRLQAAPASSTAALEPAEVDCLDRSAPLSNSLRLKTGGRNPREILAEKLRKIKGKRTNNGSLVTRSAAPSPSWCKQLPMTPQAGQISSPVAADAPRPASAHVFGEGVLPQHRPMGNGSLPSPLVDDSPLFGLSHDGGNDLAALLRLPGADSSSAFPFDDLLPLADIDGVDPLLSSDTDGGHFMNLDETLDSVVRSATQSQPDGLPLPPDQQQSAPPTVKRSRKGDKNSQGSHFCEFSDSDRACKQRAILTYRYCIRHILNDPNSPYMPCQHMRKPKSKRDTNLQCTNAIRKDKDVAYCSTHMIMMGMLEPKTKKGQSNGSAKESPSPMTALSHPAGDWPSMTMGSNGGIDHTPEGQSPGVASDGIASSTGGDWTPLSYQHHTASPYPNSPMMPPMPSAYSAQAPFAHHSPALVSPMPSPSTSSYWNSPAHAAPLQQQFMSFGAMPPQTQALHQMQPAGAPPTPQAPVNFGYQPPSLPNGFDTNGYGPSAMSPLSGQSLARSNSVASGNSRPDSTLSQAVTPGPPTAARATPGVVQSQDLPPPPPPPPVQAAGSSSKAPQQSELMRQHPELAAKLLQTVKTTVASTIAEPAVTQMAPAAQPEPTESQSHQFVRPGQAPCVSRPVVPPMPVAPSLQHLPSMAPVFQPRPLPLPTVQPTSVDGQPPKKVIRLKQKRQRMRMLGSYRQVQPVNQMCKVLEDADFDRTDLFPLGLEPSESDTDSEDGDSNLGGRTTDACFADRVLRLAQDWEAVGALGAINEHEGDSRRQLYLIKKQLRLERHRLLCSARINAAVMHASKRYPNLVGRALLDRRKRQANQLRKRMLRKALGVPKRFAGKRVEEADVVALRHRRCCFVAHGEQQRQGGRRSQCSQRCLSYSNHCLKHSLYNVDQRLFRYCAESLCGEPVVDIGMDVWLPGGGRCARHRDLRPESGMSDLTDESTSGGRRRPIRRFPCERKVKRRRRTLVKADEPDGPPRMTSSPLLDHDTSGSALMPSGSALLSGGVNEADVSLASVAKDLGFEGNELTDMLAKFPVVEGDDFDFVGPDFGIGKPAMLDQPSLASAVASAMQQPPSTLNPSVPDHCDDGADGHNWADVEQFLLSEGYQGASFQPSDGLCLPGGLLPPIGTTLGHPPPPLDAGLVHPPPPYCAPPTWTGESR